MTYNFRGDTFVSPTRELTSSGIYAVGSNSFVQVLDVPNAMGKNTGYTSGGDAPAGVPPTATNTNTIERFPFAISNNSNDVGDLSVARHLLAGQSSDVFGYSSGGGTPSQYQNTIDRFPFATQYTNAADVGDLSVARREISGQSSYTHGYTSSGRSGAPPSTNIIDKFPFASNANATDVGDLTESRTYNSGQSSATHGYISGGDFTINTIDRFSFVTDANATDVGDLTQARGGSAGNSSATHGYVSGGVFTPPGFINSNVIDRFPFASNANATDVGDLTQDRYYGAGQSSTTHGHTSAGTRQGGPTYLNTNDRFPFATNANATGFGTSGIGRFYVAGQQD